MALSLFKLEPGQNMYLADAITKGQTIAFNLTPSGGFVWPHITGNGVLLYSLSPQQVIVAKDSVARGKTLSIAAAPVNGRNECREN